MTLAIRPEDIAVQGVRGGQENAVQTRIDAMAFLGSCFRADLVADELDKARMRAELSIELVRRAGLAEGHALPIALPREAFRVDPGGALGELTPAARFPLPAHGVTTRARRAAKRVQGSQDGPRRSVAWSRERRAVERAIARMAADPEIRAGERRHRAALYRDRGRRSRRIRPGRGYPDPTPGDVPTTDDAGSGSGERPADRHRVPVLPAPLARSRPLPDPVSRQLRPAGVLPEARMTEVDQALRLALDL